MRLSTFCGLRRDQEQILPVQFNMERHYSPHRLQRGITVDSKELFQNIWRIPPSFKGKMKHKMNNECRALFTKNILKEWKNELPNLNFRLTAGSRFYFFYVLSTINSTKIWQNSKSRLGISTETRISRLLKKLERKISLDCPFKSRVGCRYMQM
jgi:hypothetical protein